MRFVAALALLAQGAAAQRPDSARVATGSTVSGVVRDTLARAPLVGAWVQIATKDSASTFARAVASDSLGRYSIDSVPVGRYVLSFFHPLLDSLGVQAEVREIRVRGRRPVRADLATPSATMLRAAICGSPESPESASGALLLGVVRAARDGTPVLGATVTGEWVEFVLRQGALERRQPRLVATTPETGAFALCDVPSAGSVSLRASRDADTTDLVELKAGPSGVLLRDLYIGTARASVTGDSAAPGETAAASDTLVPPPRRPRFGDGQLRGTVRTADGSRPLEGALVRITDGPQTRADERGEWTLVDAPSGTRVLEVRAIGFYPERRPVDVVPGAAPVHVELFTFQAVLDTVRIVVSRVSDRSQGGFDERRRSSLGRFLTAEDIARRGGTWTSDLFRMVPGVLLDGSGFERRILVRSSFGGHCAPAVYIDGLYMFDLSADEIDGIVTPGRISGIEIYSDATTPMEFQRALSGCGAIVIWTKGRPPSVRR